MPLLSIIIPTYNGEKYLKEALDSILCQTFQDWELIVVDDCSTDGTRDIVNQYINNDSRIRMIERTCNSGSARLPEKDGVHAAQGRYISLMYQDDALDIDYYEKMIARAYCTQADVILSIMAPFSEDNQYFQTIPSLDFDLKQILSGEEACKKTLCTWEINCNGFLTKKSSFQRILDENDDHYMNSDEVDSRKLLLYANTVAFANTYFNYRVHQTSITHKLTPKYFERLITNNQIYNLVQTHMKITQPTIIRALASVNISMLIQYQNIFLRHHRSFTRQQQQYIHHIFKDAFLGIKRNNIKPQTFKLALVMQSYRTLQLYSCLKYNLEKHKYEN